MTFTRQSPESVGLSSAKIYAFIASLEKANIPMHSLLIYRHGTLVTEGYYAPYTAESLHRLFSVTKSFVSVAIGELIGSGQIQLSDPVCHYFEDYNRPDIHPYIQTMTIEHLLKMETCHRSTTYKHDMTDHWVKSFFLTPPSHRPGSHFNYDTSASHTLAALVRRLTGKNVLDYLRETFLKDSHFSPEAYILNDPFGESMGGSGLMARPIDLLIFAQKVMAERSHNPYLFSATSNLTDTLIKGATLEEQQGYGYQFWQIRHGGYACYGMGGQYALCYPDQDLIIVTTADTQGLKEGNSIIFNAVNEHILNSISRQPLCEDSQSYQQLQDKLKNLSIARPSEIINKSYQCHFTLEPNASSFKQVSVAFDAKENQGFLIFYQDHQDFKIPFGFDRGIFSTFSGYDQRCFSYGSWIRSNRLHIKTHLIDECIGSIDFHLTFHDESHLSIFIKKIEETLFHEFNGYFEGSKT
jgi:CubicO group peptidase (beta-lactamase class C family)